MQRVLLIVFCAISPAVATADDWIDLLDQDLFKWEVYTGVPHKSVVVPGGPTSTSDNGQDGGKPLGLGDPLKIFSTKIIDGEIVLDVTGQVYAGLTSLSEYENYHLQLEYRWRDKKWPPRLTAKRDSGLLLHCTGGHGSFWNVWMSCLECQIQEGDTGDFIPLAGTSASVRCQPPLVPGKSLYDPAGTLYKNAGYVRHGPSPETPHGEWNKVEAYVVADRLAFVVNGVPNMVLFDARYRGKPLTRGKLQIQSEAAAIQYRRLRLKPISEFPAFLHGLTAPPAERPIDYAAAIRSAR